MAALVRHSLLIRLQKKLIPQISQPVRCISTSKNDSHTVKVPTSAELAKTDKDFSKINEDDWVSYGFDLRDKTKDRNATHSTLFVTISLCMVGGATFFAYMPDFNMKHWSHREAYLELRRREAEGLPLVDKNLIDPATIVLPPDEELGDMEIII